MRGFPLIFYIEQYICIKGYLGKELYKKFLFFLNNVYVYIIVFVDCKDTKSVLAITDLSIFYSLLK